MKTILDTIDDPNLFGPWFAKDRDSWCAWFAFLSAAFGLPMDDEQRAIYRECTGRSTPPSSPAQESWLVCGRRGGKSFVLALVAVFLACFYDYRQHLSRGERATIVVVAVDRKQARVILRYIQGLLTGVPMLERLIQRETAEGFDLNNSVTIEVGTASFRSTRGYTIVAALCDEIAFWPTDDAADPDREILAALRPGMATIPNAMLLCASSPYARRGELWEAYRRHHGRDGDPVLVWRAPTRTMNPTVPQSVIDRAMEDDPASAQAEFFAEFRGDIESFINREAIEACISRGVYERPPRPGVRYVGFIDPSGGAADSFTLAVAHQDGGELFLDVMREVKPPFSPESACAEFATTFKSYRISKIQGDKYAGAWPREQFAKLNIKYEQSAEPKSNLYQNVLPLLNSGRVHLLDHQRLISQFCGLERRTGRSGRDSIDSAAGGHDDLCNACAGALLGAQELHKHRSLWGSFGYGGPVTWRDAATGDQIDPETMQPITRSHLVRVGGNIHLVGGDNGCWSTAELNRRRWGGVKGCY